MIFFDVWVLTDTTQKDQDALAEADGPFEAGSTSGDRSSSGEGSTSGDRSSSGEGSSSGDGSYYTGKESNESKDAG